MHLSIKKLTKIRKLSAKEILCYLFLVLCFIPFLFPNPIVKTNVQPYAAIIGSIIVLLFPNTLIRFSPGRCMAIIFGGTFFFSIIVMLSGSITIDSVRGVYNYFALFVVPCAVFIVLKELDGFPEKLCKMMILLWFVVSSIQFFVYRGFATKLIGGVRWSYMYRGVVGLASEPSFLGITCFYFLHLIRKFKTQRVLFSLVALVMGVLFAQSTTGILFIAGYYLVFLFDIIGNKRGIIIWGASLSAFLSFLVYMNRNLTNSRLFQMYDALLNGGVDSVLSDGSASVRFNAIVDSLKRVSENSFFPNGFGLRIGSAYGGLLVELGFLAVPAIIIISYSISLSLNKRRSRVLYFVVVTLLLLNNTQIGNPLLLLVIGSNMYYCKPKHQIQEISYANKRVFQST